MRQNSNTIFPLITHARSSGAINWFWELSSIFNPSSGSAGRVKTSLKTRTRAEFGTFKVQAEAWKTCWQLMEPIQPGKPFNASHPGGDVCQCPSLAFHLWQAQRKAAEVRKDPAGWCMCLYEHAWTEWFLEPHTHKKNQQWNKIRCLLFLILFAVAKWSDNLDKHGYLVPAAAAGRRRCQMAATLPRKSVKPRRLAESTAKRWKINSDTKKRERERNEVPEEECVVCPPRLLLQHRGLLL